MTEHLIEVTEVIEVSLKYVIEVPTKTISNTVGIDTCLPKTRPIVTSGKCVSAITTICNSFLL